MVLSGGMTTLELGGIITVTSRGSAAPPPLLELHAVKTSMLRMRKNGMNFWGVIQGHLIKLPEPKFRLVVSHPNQQLYAYV